MLLVAGLLAYAVALAALLEIEAGDADPTALVFLVPAFCIGLINGRMRSVGTALGTFLLFVALHGIDSSPALVGGYIATGTLAGVAVRQLVGARSGGAVASLRPAGRRGADVDAPIRPAGVRVSVEQGHTPVDALLPWEEAASSLHWHLLSRAPEATAVNAFLFAAGLGQMAEDRWHRDRLGLGRAAGRLSEFGPGLASLSALARAAAATTSRLRFLHPGDRRVGRIARQLGDLTSWLAGDVADAVIAGATGLPARDVASLEPRLQDLVLMEPRRVPAGLRSEVLRPPNCFERFDQDPADCLRLVDRFAQRWPDRERPILVVGLRTSGSYLAPLVAAVMKRRGYTDARWTTIRPGQNLTTAQRAVSKDLVSRDGLAVLIDDPPRTGTQLARVAATLCAEGLPHTSVALLLQMIAPAKSLPDQLRGHPAVILEWEDWTVHERLAPPAVQPVLKEMLVGRTISVAGRAEAVSVADVGCVGEVLAERPYRGHVQAKFSCLVTDAETGDEIPCDVGVEGVGAGFFGDVAPRLAEVLQPHVSEVYGQRGGLLFRQWLPESTHLAPQEFGVRDASDVAKYVAFRRRALESPRDLALELGGRDAAWEYVANLLGDPFGHGRHFVRPMTRSAAKRLTETQRPSVIDGQMELRHWFRAADASSLPLRKARFLGRLATGSPTSYDAVFDMAGAAADAEFHDLSRISDELRDQYEMATGDAVSAERWLVYRLVHHLVRYERSIRDAARLEPSGPDAFHAALTAERAAARAHQGYMRARYLADQADPSDGPFCAIDIDGVLETRWVAFPAIGPAGATALRALKAHGRRPVLVTGRSLAEVRDRCEAYGLTGGVAEYGSVIYDGVRRHQQAVVSEAELADLAALRTVLADMHGVHVDAAYTHSVRAHVVHADRTRSGLASDVVTAALRSAGVVDRVRPVPGALQTDFVAASVDKGRGAHALVRLLGGEGSDADRPLALAVGDSSSDLAMFDQSTLSLAPRNATSDVRARVVTTRSSYGAGLLTAVSRHLGHRPESCSDCRPAEPRSADSRLLGAALSALDGGKPQKVRQAIAFALTLRNTRANV